jgi:hypothetical protein
MKKPEVKNIMALSLKEAPAFLHRVAGPMQAGGRLHGRRTLSQI